jgi:hypothetical protein
LARTGQAENSSANKNFSAEQNQAFGQAQGDIGKFNQNIQTLDRGGQVAANPWESARYLSNVNRLESGTLNSANNTGNEVLQQLNRRTGGTNTAATVGAQKELALDKMRLGSQLSSERAAGDFGKNVGYQANMAAMPLEAARAQSPFFGGAVSGQSGALRNLTDLGMASYGPWQAAMQAAGQAASAGISGAFGKPKGDGGGGASSDSGNSSGGWA